MCNIQAGRGLMSIEVHHGHPNVRIQVILRAHTLLQGSQITMPHVAWNLFQKNILHWKLELQKCGMYFIKQIIKLLYRACLPNILR